MSLSLLFRVRTRLCSLPIERLVETMRPLPIASFPGAPSFVIGVARVRGVVVPVVDVGALLGETDAPRPSRFLTLRLERHPVALAVEEVLGLREVTSPELSELPPLLAKADKEAVASIGTLDTELLLCLEAARLVPDTVWAVLNSGGPA